jgi:DNA-binding transcriptional ArsR family regulator
MIAMNQVFKALEDGTRRKILMLLREQDLSAGQIAAHFECSKPTISHHLDILRQAGLIQSARQGQYIVYTLTATVLQEVMSWLFELYSSKEKQNE